MPGAGQLAAQCLKSHVVHFEMPGIHWPIVDGMFALSIAIIINAMTEFYAVIAWACGLIINSVHKSCSRDIKYGNHSISL